MEEVLVVSIQSSHPVQDQATSRIRVYLVEDQALLRESLRAMLELEAEIDVVGETDDAEQALRELETLAVDLVLMDIRLPRMDGIEATRLLMQRHGAPKVIILTSYHDEYLEASLEAGAAGYILKSCTRQQLVQAVQAVYHGQASIDPTLPPQLNPRLDRATENSSSVAPDPAPGGDTEAGRQREPLQGNR